MSTKEVFGVAPTPTNPATSFCHTRRCLIVKIQDSVMKRASCTIEIDVCATWQVRHPGGVPFAVLIACLIVAMAVVYFTQQAGPERGRTKKGRSTDRVD